MDSCGSSPMLTRTWMDLCPVAVATLILAQPLCPQGVASPCCGCCHLSGHVNTPLPLATQNAPSQHQLNRGLCQAVAGSLLTARRKSSLSKGKLS